MDNNEQVFRESIEDTHPLKKRTVSLYVRWNPSIVGFCQHTIYCFPNGSFEVHCKHKKLDMDVIRLQISNLIKKQHFEKKNN